MPTAACPAIVVPVQAIQGEDDEYGSELQLGIIAGKVGGYCETRLVPDCGHSPHLQQPAYVLSRDHPLRGAAGAGGVAHSMLVSSSLRASAGRRSEGSAAAVRR